MKAAPVKTDGERLGNEFMNGVFVRLKWAFQKCGFQKCRSSFRTGIAYVGLIG